MRGVKNARMDKTDRYYPTDNGRWVYFYGYDESVPMRTKYKGEYILHYPFTHSRLLYDTRTTLMDITYKFRIKKRGLDENEEYDICKRIRKAMRELGYKPDKMIVNGSSYGGKFLASIMTIGKPMPTEEEIREMEMRLRNEVEVF